MGQNISLGPLSSKKVPAAWFSRLICVVMTCFGLWRVGVSRFSGDQLPVVCILNGVYRVHVGLLAL